MHAEQPRRLFLDPPPPASAAAARETSGMSTEGAETQEGGKEMSGTTEGLRASARSPGYAPSPRFAPGSEVVWVSNSFRSSQRMIWQRSGGGGVNADAIFSLCEQAG